MPPCVLAQRPGGRFRPRRRRREGAWPLLLRHLILSIEVTAEGFGGDGVEVEAFAVGVEHDSASKKVPGTFLFAGRREASGGGIVSVTRRRSPTISPWSSV